jgi:selenide,water dikinase
VALRELVLVGGGHSHVQILRRQRMRPIPGVRVRVVLDRPEAVYSGMVPGFVAGDYAAAELEIDVVPLARRAGAGVVLARALRIDPVARRIELEGRPALAYDVASLDVGSSVRGLELPGVRELALVTRPIRGFVDALEARLERAREACGERPPRIVVVGAGVAGVELGFTLSARVRAQVCVLDAEGEILRGWAPRARALARALAAQRGIELRAHARVGAVEKDAVLLESGERVACDLVVWATGAAPPPLVRDSPLPHDSAGFARVRSTLEVAGSEGLFAVGDCAVLEEHAWVPRAGVYAVRQGPVLDANLRAYLAGRPLRAYRPQREFLSLVNLGGRRALGTKWGAAFAGRAVWRLKDRIDRRFMRRFRALDLPPPGALGMARVPCGGCAAKLGAAPLAAALARLGPPLADERVLLGLERPDDAAAWRTPGGDVVLATLDAFRAFTDDPWLVGSVSAIHAASDVWAKGGRPRHALAYVHLPESDPARAQELLYQLLAGVRAALDPHRISLVGGHTTHGMELLVGLAVLGDAPHAVQPLAGLTPGEQLILTKPLGTGVLLAADMQGLVPGRRIEAVWRSMLRANAGAARSARAAGARACTDVSGFGLAGHLSQMLRESGVSARLQASALPLLDGALELVARGVRSTYHAQNAQARADLRISPARAGDPRIDLLFDPQTSGGLLFGVAAARVDEVVRACGGEGAAVIGEVRPARTDGALLEVV